MGHLKDTNSTWTKHFLYASYYNLLGILMILTGIIHSVFPFLFRFLPYRLAKMIVEGTEKHFKHDH